jgi:hypothetical protein
VEEKMNGQSKQKTRWLESRTDGFNRQTNKQKPKQERLVKVIVIYFLRSKSQFMFSNPQTSKIGLRGFLY